MAVVIPAGYLKQPCFLELNNNHKLKRLTVVWYSDCSYFTNLKLPSPHSKWDSYILSVCGNKSDQWVGHVLCGVLSNSGNLLVVTACQTVLTLFCLWMLVGDTRYSQRADQHSLLQCTGDKFWMQLNPGVLITRKGRCEYRIVLSVNMAFLFVILSRVFVGGVCIFLKKKKQKYHVLKMPVFR